MSTSTATSTTAAPTTTMPQPSIAKLYQQWSNNSRNVLKARETVHVKQAETQKAMANKQALDGKINKTREQSIKLRTRSTKQKTAYFAKRTALITNTARHVPQIMEYTDACPIADINDTIKIMAQNQMQVITACLPFKDRHHAEADMKNPQKHANKLLSALNQFENTADQLRKLQLDTQLNLDKAAKLVEQHIAPALAVVANQQREYRSAHNRYHDCKTSLHEETAKIQAMETSMAEASASLATAQLAYDEIMITESVKRNALAKYSHAELVEYVLNIDKTHAEVNDCCVCMSAPATVQLSCGCLSTCADCRADSFTHSARQAANTHNEARELQLVQAHVALEQRTGPPPIILDGAELPINLPPPRDAATFYPTCPKCRKDIVSWSLTDSNTVTPVVIAVPNDINS